MKICHLSRSILVTMAIYHQMLLRAYLFCFFPTSTSTSIHYQMQDREKHVMLVGAFARAGVTETYLPNNPKVVNESH